MRVFAKFQGFAICLSLFSDNWQNWLEPDCWILPGWQKIESIRNCKCDVFVRGFHIIYCCNDQDCKCSPWYALYDALLCLIWTPWYALYGTLICLIWYLDMPWCAFNTWCLDMSYMNTLIYLIWCLEMPWCAFNIWCLESRPLICLICTPWYALYGALRACQWRVRSQLSHSLLSSCLGFNQCQYCLSIFPIVIFLHSNESCFSLLLSSIISFTRGEVGVSSSAFPFTLHRFRVHRDQEAKIFRHSVQQVPSQTLNKLESGDQLLVGTGDNYTDTVISMESFATHVKEEALKFWSFEALRL